mgnify:CR=1 FL=1
MRYLALWLIVGMGFGLLNLIVYNGVMVPLVKRGLAGEAWKLMVEKQQAIHAKNNWIGEVKGHLLCTVVWPLQLLGFAFLLATYQRKEE